MTTQHRSPCPISSFLDLLGDKWTLLVVRDLLVGKTRFGEIEAGHEHIPTSILANRMKALVAHGIVTRVQYSERPTRFEYHLTEKGAALRPVLIAMSNWSEQNLADRWHTPDWFHQGRPAPGRV